MTSSPAYAVHPTPIGEALVVVTDAGLAHLDVLDVHVGAAEAALARVALALHAAPVHDPGAVGEVTTQLDEYFAGDRREFSVTLDLGGTAGFVRSALDVIAAIPYGEVWSYADVAVAAGSPGANRAVGSACARTPISLVIPAHRVVRSDGSIGEYGGHPERKRYLLDFEARVLGASAVV